MACNGKAGNCHPGRFLCQSINRFQTWHTGVSKPYTLVKISLSQSALLVMVVSGTPWKQIAFATWTRYILCPSVIAWLQELKMFDFQSIISRSWCYVCNWHMLLFSGLIVFCAFFFFLSVFLPFLLLLSFGFWRLFWISCNLPLFRQCEMIAYTCQILSLLRKKLTLWFLWLDHHHDWHCLLYFCF